MEGAATAAANAALALSPPYWVPFLIALIVVLIFLYAIFTKLFSVVIRPLLHTLDQVNETLVGLSATNGRLVEKMAVMIDRGNGGGGGFHRRQEDGQ